MKRLQALLTYAGGFICLLIGIYLVNSVASCGQRSYWQERENKDWVKSGELIDVNRSSPKDLRRLPGIGPVFADRIVQNRPYANPGEMLRIPGMGNERLNRIIPHITGFTSRPQLATTPTPPPQPKNGQWDVSGFDPDVLPTPPTLPRSKAAELGNFVLHNRTNANVEVTIYRKGVFVRSDALAKLRPGETWSSNYPNCQRRLKLTTGGKTTDRMEINLGGGQTILEITGGNDHDPKFAR